MQTDIKTVPGRTLKRGMRGGDVKQLQQALIKLGYGGVAGSADGIFGRRTEAAVKAFQLERGLCADGVAGKLTFVALDVAAAIERGGRKQRFLSYLKAQLGEIYVWGGDGEIMSEPLICRMETSIRNITRATALYHKRAGEGRAPILGYDCSGLISRFLEDEGLEPKKRNSRYLYSRCTKLEKGELAPCDLVFRHNGLQIYHVGVYMGNGLVIESKGRDDGVVERRIDASGTAYWNRFGRLAVLG